MVSTESSGVSSRLPLVKLLVIDNASQRLTSSEGLGEKKYIRDNISVLKSEDLSRSAETALDLIENERDVSFTRKIRSCHYDEDNDLKKHHVFAINKKTSKSTHKLIKVTVHRQKGTYAVILLSPCKNSTGAGMTPPSPWMGSKMMAKLVLVY